MAPSDPMANQHAFYDAQHDEISELFQEENTDWDTLATKLVAALEDPFLPRWYRATFHAIYAWHSSDPEEQIRLAKDVVEDMRRVLEVEGKNEEEIEKRLDPIKQMIVAVEGALTDGSEDEDELEGEHATSAQ